jgi:predicted PurR-regulated permease PerM
MSIFRGSENSGGFDLTGIIQNVTGVLGNSVSTIVQGAVSTIGSVASFAMDLFVAIVFAVYCLFQKETLARQGRKILYAFTKEPFADRVIHILRLSNSTFSNFLSGQCIEVCILGVMIAVSMAILKLPYIPLVSVLVAVTAFIPIVGAWVGCVVGVFFMLVNDPMQAVWFLLMFLVVQQIEGNLIYPKVVGTSIGLSGMWVIVAISVGGDLFGVVGMLLMIPFASVIQTILREEVAIRVYHRKINPEKLEAQPPILKSHLKETREKNKEKRQIRRKNRKTNSK